MSPFGSNIALIDIVNESVLLFPEALIMAKACKTARSKRPTILVPKRNALTKRMLIDLVSLHCDISFEQAQLFYKSLEDFVLKSLEIPDGEVTIPNMCSFHREYDGHVCMGVSQTLWMEVSGARVPHRKGWS